MALGELLALQQGEHGIGEVEEADQVGDSRAAPAHPAGELLLGDAQVVDESGTGPGLLHRIEVLADHVLDQGGLQALVLGRGPDNGRDAVDARLLRRAPAPLTGDELVPPVLERPDDQRLEQPDRADRSGQGIEGGGVELGTGLVRIGLDLGDVELAQLRSAGGALRQDGRKPPPHSALAFSHRCLLRREPHPRAHGRPSIRGTSHRAPRPECRSWEPRRRARCAGRRS